MLSRALYDNNLWIHSLALYVHMYTPMWPLLLACITHTTEVQTMAADVSVKHWWQGVGPASDVRVATWLWLNLPTQGICYCTSRPIRGTIGLLFVVFDHCKLCHECECQCPVVSVHLSDVAAKTRLPAVFVDAVSWMCRFAREVCRDWSSCVRGRTNGADSCWSNYWGCFCHQQCRPEAGRRPQWKWLPWTWSVSH